MKQLKPAKNFKRIVPRCCATCEYLGTNEENWRQCQRVDGLLAPDVDESADIYRYVCDGYKVSGWSKLVIEYEESLARQGNFVNRRSSPGGISDDEEPTL